MCKLVLLRFINAVVFGVHGFDTCMRHTRLAGPHITTGHFDVIPGELRLKARESRCMTTFLAVCLRALCTSLDEGAHTVELKLCTVLATNLSNWSLELEQCDIDLTYEQALHLHRTGHEWLNMFLWYKFSSSVSSLDSDPLVGWHTAFWFSQASGCRGLWDFTSPWVYTFWLLVYLDFHCVRNCMCLACNKSFFLGCWFQFWLQSQTKSWAGSDCSFPCIRFFWKSCTSNCSGRKIVVSQIELGVWLLFYVVFISCFPVTLWGHHVMFYGVLSLGPRRLALLSRWRLHGGIQTVSTQSAPILFLLWCLFL